MNFIKPYLSLKNISIRISDKFFFKNASWEVQNDEHWVILGPNGAGKSTLVKALWGGVAVASGQIVFQGNRDPISYKKKIGYVSFELQQHLREYENKQEERRPFSGGKTEFMTAEEVILSSIAHQRKVTRADLQILTSILRLLRITDLRKRHISALSTGETRKVLIARALMKNPELLILDEPFDGLDARAREGLMEVLTRLNQSVIPSEAIAESRNLSQQTHKQFDHAAQLKRSLHSPYGLGRDDMKVILIVHRVEEISVNTTHVLFVKDGNIFAKGTKEEMLTSKSLSHLYDCVVEVQEEKGRYSIVGVPLVGTLGGNFVSTPGQAQDLPLRKKTTEPLIEMKNVTVKYGKTIVLNKLNWTMRQGEHWAILGPNGSGKTTLLQLITGDNLQAYANEIRLFGKKKGSGESVWEIKKRIGYVSASLQMNYLKHMSVLDVVLSGFYDSIGLYRQPTQEQTEKAKEMIKQFQLSDFAERNFYHLSYGQKRLVLIARAMVKSPMLLILDEPCHGLDIANRTMILEHIKRIGTTTATSLLYVTHHQEEIVPCISHVLTLSKHLSSLSRWSK